MFKSLLLLSLACLLSFPTPAAAAAAADSQIMEDLAFCDFQLPGITFEGMQKCGVYLKINKQDFNYMDTNGDGQLDEAEFLRFLLIRLGGYTKQDEALL